MINSTESSSADNSNETNPVIQEAAAKDDPVPVSLPKNDAPAVNDSDAMEEEDDASTSSSSSFSSSEDAGKAGGSSADTGDMTDLIAKALTLKEEGNKHFKSGKLDRAGRSYRRGTSTLKPLNNGQMENVDDQVKSLLLSLQMNLSLVCLKQGKAKMSRDVASKALEIDGTNVKALYRRGVAHRKLGDVRCAQEDLRAALKIDPNNREVRKELIVLKKDMQLEKDRQKRASGFLKKQGNSFSLYDDKVKEEERKLKEKVEQEKAKEEALKKRKQQWEDDCVARMSRDEAAVSYDEWDTEQKKKEEEEKKKLKKLKNEEDDRKRREREERRRLERAKKKENNECNGDDSDEEILRDVRGYKKMSDGRTTSYFTRELDEKEKALIGDITPKMIDSSNHSSTTATSPINKKSSKESQSSAWNAAGTWEEKNTTDWCRSKFKVRLLEASAVHGEYAAMSLSVSDVSGDASVANVSGKKRYIFDFSCNVTVDFSDEQNEKLASAELKLIDINSAAADDDDYDMEYRWKKQPPKEKFSPVEACKKLFIESVHDSIKNFIQDFNSHY